MPQENFLTGTSHWPVPLDWDHDSPLATVDYKHANHCGQLGPRTISHTGREEGQRAKRGAETRSGYLDTLAATLVE